MEAVLIWNVMFANIDFVGHVDYQKEVFFIECKLIPERQELYVFSLINILTDKEIQIVCASRIYL